MDLTTISAAYEGLKYAKDTIKTLSGLKIETKTIQKINEAVKKVGDAQDILFGLREALFRLQDENRGLRNLINENDEWAKRKSKYELTTTDGGAVVYQSLEGTKHFACPNCIERKEIQILQDKRVLNGEFGCPGCGKTFPINPMKPLPAPIFGRR